MADQMRCIQFESTGNPVNVLEIREVPVPEPGPGEVRIKVLASPINPADLMFVQGLYGIKPKLPSGVGFEGMGTVDVPGKGVDLAAGTRVSFTGLGAWAEYIVVPAKNIIALPDNISDEAGAQLFVNPFTAFALLHELELKKNDWLMITAAGSALGKLMIGLCKTRGYKTIATVRRDNLIDDLKNLGADEVVNTTEGKLPERVKEITDGKGVACVMDAVGGNTGAAALACLGRGGTMLIYGSLSLEPVPMNSGLIIFKSLRIKGFWLVDWMRTASSELQQEVAGEVIEWLASGKSDLPVDAQYDLSEIVKATVHSDSAGRNGKILLVNNK